MDKRQQALFEREPAPWEFDEQAERLLASVVFAETPHGPFDYIVPDELRDEVEAGRRVRVPLGRGNRMLVGYCVELRNDVIHSRNFKAIQSVVDSHRLLPPSMLRLSAWMAERYLCERGQAIEA
ncbi:MAG: primosomal protein N', partial [Planctomycetes bacterium]|nr:primosomal protein N' [Planctomycetota bacterium]